MSYYGSYEKEHRDQEEFERQKKLHEKGMRDIVSVSLVFRQDFSSPEDESGSGGETTKPRFFRRLVRLSVKKVSFNDTGLAKRIEKFLLERVKPKEDDWISYDMQITIPLYNVIDVEFIGGDTASRHFENLANTVSLSDEISLIDVTSIDGDAQ